MDRNYITGTILLFILFVVWYFINAPTAEELERHKFVQDSIAQVEEAARNAQAEVITPHGDTAAVTAQTDSLQVAPLQETRYTLSNDVLALELTSRGGYPIKATLPSFINGYQKEVLDNPEPVHLFDTKGDRYDVQIPTRQGTISTRTLNFSVAKQTNNSLELVAQLPSGGSVSQAYSLEPGSYEVNYQLDLRGTNGQLDLSREGIKIDWVNQLNKLEKNVDFEKMYSTIYFHEKEEGTDHCSCTGSDEETVDRPIAWVAHSNQFFSSILQYTDGFERGAFDIQASPERTDPFLKRLHSEVYLPLDQEDPSYAMKWYIGPNDYEGLKTIGNDLSDIVPYGWSIFGTINRWVIRPIFNILSSFIGSMGIVILVLTLIVKAAVFPLTYRMLYSQSKMAALKPLTKDLNEKFKDDPQKRQMESMKIYREYGVNPVGGCLPMVLQMPIWFALYRFFPASIDFRQASFLWANDLSSYDSIFQLPTYLPMMGDHISLFTLLWAASMLFYTWWNTKNNMDMSAQMNPMMKSMQYIMPIMFFVFLNNYASGLTCYLMFSNMINIGQNMGTKKFLIDEEKIKEQLRANKAKPKKKGGFQARLEEALKEQQRQQQQKQKKK